MPRPKGKTNLTDQQRRFAQAFTRLGNATAAAREAGYEGESVRTIARDLLKNPGVKKYLDELWAPEAMGKEEIVARLSRHARVNTENLLDDDGELSLAKAREAEVLDLVTEITRVETTFTDAKGNTTTTTKHKVKLVDSQAALDKLGRVRGVYKEASLFGDQAVEVVFKIGGKKE